MEAKSNSTSKISIGNLLAAIVAHFSSDLEVEAVPSDEAVKNCTETHKKVSFTGFTVCSEMASLIKHL
jgi:hypothetical protein